MSTSAIAILAVIALARTSIVGPVQHALAAIDADSLSTMISLAAVAGSAVAGWAGAKRGNKGVEKRYQKLTDEYVNTQSEVRNLRLELRAVKKQRNELRAENQQLREDAAGNSARIEDLEGQIAQLKTQIRELQGNKGG